MKHQHFISKLDDAQIVAALKTAETQSTGHIRVFVSKRPAPDPVRAAAKHFKALRLHKSPLRNAVLIFLAPKSKTFAIFGDQAIHEKCGDPFWSALRDEMTPHLKDSNFTQAILHAIHRAAQLLAQHFPPQPKSPPP